MTKATPKKAASKAAPRKTYAERVAATYAGKSVTPTTVAERFRIDRGNACRILQALCARGAATQDRARGNYLISR